MAAASKRSRGQRKLPGETEEQFQRAVVKYAILRKWMVHHARKARRKDGEWRTPIQGHAGYVDLTLARSGTVLLVELKSERGKRTQGQADWAVNIPERMYRLWRPSDWKEIERELR